MMSRYERIEIVEEYIPEDWEEEYQYYFDHQHSDELTNWTEDDFDYAIMCNIEAWLDDPYAEYKWR